jgi:hypothetical protein
MEPDEPKSFPMAHFGTADDKPIDWSAMNDADPDDEELEESPPDVVMMLGFDPKTVDWDSVGEPEEKL